MVYICLYFRLKYLLWRAGGGKKTKIFAAGAAGEGWRAGIGEGTAAGEGIGAAGEGIGAAGRAAGVIGAE